MLKVNEATRVVTQTDKQAYLDLKSKRQMMKRIANLEATVETMQRQIQDLLGHKES